jgi:FkbM family methyltransferase
MLEKIKARLPGGIYFQDLMKVFSNVLKKKITVRDKYLLEIFFVGSYYAGNSLSKLYRENNHLNINGILLPILTDKILKGNLITEFLDFIYPYLYNDYSNTGGEGPYLYHQVQIKKGDIVIDAGANMGLFSALASHLGGIVYAFEPVKEIREKYLEKTAQLNPNINIVPLALSNKTGTTDIYVNSNNLGGSSIILQGQSGTKETILTTTLDDWVKQNNIPKVDFIKADIEGAERLMLEGAQWVLKTYAPKLAICTYHLPDDKEVLTNLILQANPNYKIEYAWQKLYAWVEK